jgi:hypothetical protein
MFKRLFSAEGQSRSAKTVEVFGWLILLEGTMVLFAPHFAVSILGIPLQTTFGWSDCWSAESACFTS